MKSKGFFLAAIFAAVLCFSGHVLAALSGSGTEANPYLIQSRADFDEFSNPANATLYWTSGIHTKLMCNLDLGILSGYNIFTQALIAPDLDNTVDNGFQGTQFNGVFDGNSHIITTLCIDSSNKDFIGLFGYVGTGGQIRDLGIEYVQSIGRQYVGGLVGYNAGSIISCRVMGFVMGITCVGGLAGITDDYGSLSLCYAEGRVNGTGYQVGGLVGYNCQGSIFACCSAGVVSSTNDFTGGLVGYNSSSIISCYAVGAVSGTLTVGGLVGLNDQGIIKYSYATGLVTGTNWVGGLMGGNYGLAVACFWDTQTTGQTTGVGDGSSVGINGKTTEEMRNPSTFLNDGWDFVSESTNGLNDYWQMETNEYPHFSMAPWTLAGEGTAGSPYIIVNTEDMGKVWLKPASHYCLSGNLDLSGIKWTTAVVPLFTGSFDGAGFVFSNLSMNLPDSDNIGLFGTVSSGGQIKNTGVENSAITGHSNVGGLVGLNYGGSINTCHAEGVIIGTGDSIGGLSGSNSGSIDGCHAAGSISGTRSYVGGLAGSNSGSISDSHVTGTVNGASNTGGMVGWNTGSINSSWAANLVSGSYHVGGMVGYQNTGSMAYCHATGQVNSTAGSVGGLVGWNDGSTLTACYTTGAVMSTGYDVGGLVGMNENDAAMIFCYATGSAGGSYNVGGLVGQNAGLITSCYSTAFANGNSAVGGLAGRNSGSITSCYAAGPVSGAGSVGGLVGANRIYTVIYSSFWDNQTCGQTKGVGYGSSSGVAGKTTAEMMSVSTFTSAAWDFSDTDGDAADWMMLRENEDYPRLAWQTIYPGDIAGLYGVNLTDYAELARNWMEQGCPASCEQADIDNSGTVDLADLSILAANWMQGAI